MIQHSFPTRRSSDLVAALLSLFISGEPRFLALLFAIVVAPLTALLAFFFLPRET